MILPMLHKREIGLKLLQDNLDPFLNAGITLKISLGWERARLQRNC